jgi:hypothetical protein
VSLLEIGVHSNKCIAAVDYTFEKPTHAFGEVLTPKIPQNPK